MAKFIEQQPIDFLKSALCQTPTLQTNEEIINWLKEWNETINVNINKTTFSNLNSWVYDSKKNNIRHSSGRFFSIDGITVETNWGNIPTWDQPIINQPEVGYLGIIAKEFNGILHFLLQAKIEPGNINNVQLSPTLQATRSNYTQVHGGKKPDYLDYFQNASQNQIILDQLQSEQGARFLRKRNRNIIIKVDEDIIVKNNFIWLTLAQIKSLMCYDNLINMDTRTVISGLSYGNYSKQTTELLTLVDGKNSQTLGHKFLKSAIAHNSSIHSNKEITTFITDIKSTYDLFVNKTSLKHLDKWVFTDEEIHHEENKYFKVIAVDVNIENREIVSWSQPMIQPAQEGICAFVCKEINGIIHFAVQAKLECGNHDIIELAPTVQCLTGNYRNTKSESLPFLDYVLNVRKENIVFDTFQSEEGGRFYKEQNRNMLVMADESVSEELPKNYIWMSFNQILEFLKYNNYFNIQARSLIAAIEFI